jgi:UDP-3-O-[3-hydroxymyristoyl] N-acetylglucosamine deacetylase
VRRHSYRFQRTLARPAEVHGVGFLTGARVRLRFRPAPPSAGVVFVRTDRTPPVEIHAAVARVTGTHRRTTLGEAPGQVSLIEHVLAALAGLKIDNCYVELNAPEPPGLDGSAQAFVEALRDAGVAQQAMRREICCVDEPVIVSRGGATLALHPAADHRLRLSYLLDYGLGAPIHRQICTVVLTPENFGNELACCRTFILEGEAAELRRQGIGARVTPRDLLVFGRRGPIDNALRFADEPARHKILDLIGDLALIGHDLVGHVVAYRSGHPLNVELVRELRRLRMPNCTGAVRRRAA